jgi:hypothetical protein
MAKTKLRSGHLLGITLGLLLVVVGIVVFVAIPVIGWVVGPLIGLAGLACGGKSRKVWRCRSCGSVIERA